MTTTMREMDSRATNGNPSSRNEMVATALPVECEIDWPVDASLNEGTVDSNRESPDISPDTRDTESSTDVEMDEGRMVKAANEVQGPRTAIGPSRGPVLPADFEGDVPMLKARLRKKGADQQAIEQCDTVFENGVTIEALEKRMTREQCERLRVRDGKQFRLFLAVAAGEGVVDGRMAERHRCCLCPPGKEYKNHRDALRHLIKDHFGLSFKCGRWSVSSITWKRMLTDARQHSSLLHAPGIDEAH